MKKNKSINLQVPKDYIPGTHDTLVELGTATDKFPDMNSAHEGFAILKEEVDELWEAVRMKQGSPERIKQIRKEAIQVAAMALRLIGDICDKNNNS